MKGKGDANLNTNSRAYKELRSQYFDKV